MANNYMHDSMLFLTICRDVPKTPKQNSFFKMAKEGSDCDLTSNSVILENL